MTEFRTKGSFKVLVNEHGTDRELVIVTKWGESVVARLDGDQALEIARALGGSELGSIGSTRCDMCPAPATFVGPDPYALEISGLVEEIRLCEADLQSRYDEI